MAPDLSERVFLVTGASSGLGEEIARGVVGTGARLVAVARRSDRLDALRDELGPQVMPCPLDVTQPRRVADLAARLSRERWRPDVLVCAAGVFGPIAPIVDGDPAAWWATLETNTLAPYLFGRAFAPGMAAAGWGRIVNITSAASLHAPSPLNSAYATSKVALNHLTRHLAAELRGTGVTANVLHPGDMQTEMWGDIRAQAIAAGPAAEPFVAWTDWVTQTGGDPPSKAVRVILEHAADPDPPTGRFLWIDDPLQAPIPSWEDSYDATPWE